MRPIKYRQATGQIILCDTLDVIDLNKSAQVIFEAHLHGKSETEIAIELRNQFGISIEESLEDAKLLLKELDEIGVLKSFSSVQCQLNINTAIVHVIKNCNSKCLVCDCWKAKGHNFLEITALKKLFSWLKYSANAQSIMVSGGEPLLHKDIKAICSNIKTMNLKVLLNTNGLLLHKNPWISSQTVDELMISMDGFDSKSYSAIRGIDAYDIVWSNIALLKKSDPNLKISLRLILNRENIDGLYDIFMKSKENDIYRVGISPLDISSASFGRDKGDDILFKKLSSQFLPSKEQMSNLRFKMTEVNTESDSYFDTGLSDWSKEDINRCLQYYEDLGSHSEVVRSSEPCLFPMTSILIDYDGSIKPCFYSEALATLDAPQAYEDNFKNGLIKIKNSKQCVNCRGKVFCDVQF